jgi:hypothetical protein
MEPEMVGGERGLEMRQASRHNGLKAVAAGLGLTVLALVLGVALQTTATPGPAAAQEPAKAGVKAPTTTPPPTKPVSPQELAKAEANALRKRLDELERLVKGQESAKAEPGALPVLAAGFVTAKGRLIRAGGAKLSVEKEKAGVYRLTFAQKLSSAPVAVVTGDGECNVHVVSATRKGFTVHCSSVRDDRLRNSGFNFIVVKVSEHTP